METTASQTRRRPRHSIPKPTGRADRSLEWTASRCHRLLRPLLSRIALLRKELTAVPHLPPDAASPGAEVAPAKRRGPECHWMAPRKRMRHTYSMKCTERSASAERESDSQSGAAKLRVARDFQHPAEDALAPGDLVPVTPLLRRARGQQLLSSPLQEPARAPRREGPRGRKPSSGRPSNESTRATLEVRLGSVRSGMASSRFSDYDAIFRGFESLLKGTSTQAESNKGVSSMLDLCLKKMPHYIAGIQAWELDEAERNGTKSAFESSTTSFRIYTDLEYFGALNAGWQHLRTVARADGVKAIKDALAEGLFMTEFAIALIDLCAEHGAHKEVDDLLEAFLDRQYPDPSGPDAKFSEDATHRPLTFLWELCLRTGRPGLVLRYYTRLLAGGALPAAWLATEELRPVWGLAHRLISKSSAAAEAVSFFVASVTTLSRHQTTTGKSPLQGLDVMETRIWETLTRSLAILSAMGTVGEQQLGEGVHSQVELQNIRIVGRNVTYTLQACLAELGVRKGRSTRIGGDLLRLASFLSSAYFRSSATPRLRVMLEAIFDGTAAESDAKAQRRAQEYSSIVSLISCIARTSGHGSSKATHEHLERLCQHLAPLGLTTHTLESIKKAGAICLAQQTNNLKDLIYAEKLIAGPVSGSSSEKRQKPPPGQLMGYRWEETISEWVIASPVAKKKPAARRSLRISSGAIVGAEEANSAARGVRPSRARSNGATDFTRDVSPRASRAMARRRASEGHEHEAKRQGQERHLLTQADNIMKPSQEGRNGDCGSCRLNGASTQDDELGDGKENQHRTGRPGRPRAHGTTRRPLGSKRRVQLTGGQHSDDELGI